MRERSTTNSSRSAATWKCSRRLTWRPYHHLSMRTTTSAIAIDFPSPSLKAVARSRRLALARRSSRVNSSSVTRTKPDRPPICRNPKLSRATAATWRIAGCKSMSAGSASSYIRTLELPRNRSFWRRSSWAAGGVVRRSCYPQTKTIQYWRPIRSGTTTSTTKKWTRRVTRCR